MVRLLIADDQKLVRQGIRAILNREKDIQVIGEARDGHEAIALAKELHPDVITMDIRMPGLDGLEATRRIRAAQPDAKILIVAMSWNGILVQQAARAGASGYMSKTDLTELGLAIRTVYEQKHYFSTTIAHIVSGQNLTLPPPTRN